MPASSRLRVDRPFSLTVLAGVNGAGKSSVGGAHLRQLGGVYFNPDEAARRARELSPTLSETEANSYGWNQGRRLLESAIAARVDFAFETTLGGNTITALLIDAAQKRARLNVWYVGLASVELHLQRVAARVEKGGHPIPEHDVRRRWTASMLNLIKLVPHISRLRVYDNSAEANPALGQPPEPRLILSVEGRQIVFPSKRDFGSTPAWAKPIVASAWREFGRSPC